jgi:uncharacterized protein YbjT (DUF2867 family)
MTGATGFVGRHLSAELLNNGVEVTALCRESSPNLSRLPAGTVAVCGADSLNAAAVF